MFVLEGQKKDVDVKMDAWTYKKDSREGDVGEI